jgi:NADPH2 dehydrogenase
MTYLIAAGMRMPDPIPTFAEAVKCIRDAYPDFAYIHVLEPPATEESSATEKPSNKVLRDIWGDRPYIANTGFGRDTAIKAVEEEGGLVSFGRDFTSNVGIDRFHSPSNYALISRF